MKANKSQNKQFLEGFSKLPADEKAKIISNFTDDPEKFLNDIHKHRYQDATIQDRYQDFSENTITNYFLPYGIAPNFLINQKIYHIPMVIEESSVVAAASSGAKFWFERGGFHTRINSTIKSGQIHFQWYGDSEKLIKYFNEVKKQLLEEIRPHSKNMIRRGGGVLNIHLNYFPNILDNYYQVNVEFDTVDSMGANFINTLLEIIGNRWKKFVSENTAFSEKERSVDLIMAILSNYTPRCIVKCYVETPVNKLNDVVEGWSAAKFIDRFSKAVSIATKDVNRAVTHNKGIFNGIDAVVLATGNDFRAVEANGHVWASRKGNYTSLSEVLLDNDIFRFQLEVPLSVGTIGGLTRLHPMASHSLELLGWPDAKELMGIMAAVGLASNFSAIKSLISTGIQAGHMKLHLSNILAQANASADEVRQIQNKFRGKKITYQAVIDFLKKIRET